MKKKSDKEIVLTLIDLMFEADEENNEIDSFLKRQGIDINKLVKEGKEFLLQFKPKNKEN